MRKGIVWTVAGFLVVSLLGLVLAQGTQAGAVQPGTPTPPGQQMPMMPTMPGMQNMMPAMQQMMQACLQMMAMMGPAPQAQPPQTQ